MDSLQKTYILGLASAKVSLKYWEEEHQRFPTEETLKQIEFWGKELIKFEKKVNEYIEKFKKAKSIEDYFDLFESIIETLKDVLKLFK